MSEETHSPEAEAAPQWTESLANYRNVLTVTAGLTLLQAAISGLAVYVVLALRAGEVSSLGIGFVTSTYALGFLVGTVSAAHEIRMVGHIRAYAIFAALASLAAFGFAIDPSLVWWALLQFVVGLCAAGLMTVGDSWIADSAPEEQRGGILGFYFVVTKTGVVAGPFLVSFLAGEPGAGLMLAAALFTASLLPVAATRRSQPDAPSPEPFGPRELWSLAPAAVIAAFCAGMINNGVGQLYPVFASTLDETRPEAMAAYFNAALIAGAMSAQWPFGAVSDLVDRRLVVAACALLGALASVIFLVVGTGLGLVPTLFISALYGAGALSFYGIAVAHAADRAGPGRATPMMAGILLVWGIGSIAGPLLGGVAMSLSFGERGLFLFSGVFFIFLFAAMLLRRVDRAQVVGEEKESYGFVPATSLSVAEIDPRGEEDEQLDLFAYLGDLADDPTEPAHKPDAQGGA